MKNIMLAVLLLTVSTQVFGQNMNQQRMQTLKVSFITNALDLTTQEAEKFWPIYNQYNGKIIKAKNALDRDIFHKYAEMGNLDGLTDEQATEFLEEVRLNEKLIYDHKGLLYSELQKAISTKKILKLIKAERDFNRRILQEFGRRNRMMRNGQKN